MPAGDVARPQAIGRMGGRPSFTRNRTSRRLLDRPGAALSRRGRLFAKHDRK